MVRANAITVPIRRTGYTVEIDIAIDPPLALTHAELKEILVQLAIELVDDRKFHGYADQLWRRAEVTSKG